MRRAPLLIIASVVAIVLLVGLIRFAAAPPGKTASHPPLRVAFNTWIGYSSFYIAEKEGLFKKYGVEVQPSVIDALADKNAAVLRGDLDGMGGTIDSAVISKEHGVDGSIMMMFDRSNGTDGILVAKGIDSIHDLAGKTVAVEEGFVDHFFLLYMLDKNGMPPSSVQIVPMSTDAAGTAFAAGRVDAAVTYEPFLTSALARPGSHVLVDSSKVEPILADTLFLSTNVIRSRPKDVENLIRALVEANAMWKANPNKYLSFVAAKWSLKDKDIVDTMKTVELYDCTGQRALFSGSPSRVQTFVAKAADLWLRSGVIKQAVDPTSLVQSGPVLAACSAQ